MSSPIARALIGKEAGESVDVQTPGGLKRYEIIDVRYENGARAFCFKREGGAPPRGRPAQGEDTLGIRVIYPL